MRFRNTTTGVDQTAEPDTKRYDIFEHSTRWQAVDESDTTPDEPLAALTVAELKALAAEHGVEIPADVRKARLVEIVRDAGIDPPAEEVEA